MRRHAEKTPSSTLSQPNLGPSSLDIRLSFITKKTGLQETLLRQLGMFTECDEEFHIGEEIIGNIDDNGYLKATLEEICASLQIPVKKAEKVLKLIQQFEPPGVAARDIAECLLIQLKLANENDPLLKAIVQEHLDDVAKKNYNKIAKSLGEPLEKIEPLIKMILRLDPKPGRNYSAEETQHVIPDIQINLKEKDEDEDEFVSDNRAIKITINNEDLPDLKISETYKQMLEGKTIDPKTKEYLSTKLQKAMELLRAISRRQTTLRSIVELAAQIQEEAIKVDFSFLKPLTFAKVAEKLKIHESTVSRAVMNKYVKTPNGLVALKDFFTSSLNTQSGQTISSNYPKRLILELINKEDKKHPLSDKEIRKIISQQYNLDISRRTVAKYREELKILSTPYRRER